MICISQTFSSTTRRRRFAGCARNCAGNRSRSQDIHPYFIRELAGWGKNEEMLELIRPLEGELPPCTTGPAKCPARYTATCRPTSRSLRNLPKDKPSLRRKGKDRWYVPDPRKAGDIERLRERALLREFDGYRETSKRLKRFRSEAIRTGFRRAWQDQDYGTIVSVGRRIPDSVLQNDPKLLMWYDQAVTRGGGEP